MRAEYHPQAADDLNTAIAYHNNLRSGLGDRLRLAVYDAVDRILENPGRHHMVRNDVRRYLVAGFPYSVLYRIVDESLVRILVIRHHRRDPNFGSRRT